MEARMSQRLSTVLLAAGLFLGATPVAASATVDFVHHGGRSCWYHDDDWDRASAHGSGDYDHHREHDR
jgi:hypothetical protein